MFSIVYTPTEGDAIQNYSRLFRRPQGVFLNIHDIDRVHADLARWGTADDIDYIVVTGKTCSRLPSRPAADTKQTAKRSSVSATRGAAAS